MGMEFLAASDIRDAYHRFCQLRHLDHGFEATARFWIFLKTSTEQANGSYHVDLNGWKVPEGALERMNLLLSPHAKALLKAHDIRQAHIADTKTVVAGK